MADLSYVMLRIISSNLLLPLMPLVGELQDHSFMMLMIQYREEAIT
jgi:hypothetical protein